VIWGAGRIGRGFVADLFDRAGYRLTLIDQAPELIAELRRAGRYTLVYAPGHDQPSRRVLTGFTALATAETSAVAAAVAQADWLALAVFARDFPAVVRELQPGIQLRRTQRPQANLDILLCTNLSEAARAFEAQLHTIWPPDLLAYAAQHIGLVETLVMRMVTEPPPAEREREPLLVWTNGVTEFPVARCAFKGEIPQVPGLRLVDNMRAEETRKLYTYNTFHATLAYHGARLGYRLIVDCLADPEVCRLARGALQEASQALQAEYGFGAAEMGDWVQQVVRQTDNPSLGDTVERFAADPRRKLQRHDRLLGPALLARKHGISPRHLSSAIAAALLYHNPTDAGAQYVQEQIARLGVTGALREICQLDTSEEDLACAIAQAYDRLAGDRAALMG